MTPQHVTTMICSSSLKKPLRAADMPSPDVNKGGTVALGSVVGRDVVGVGCLVGIGAGSVKVGYKPF